VCVSKRESVSVCDREREDGEGGCPRAHNAEPEPRNPRVVQLVAELYS
jgi:hypothetical protein